ncbi:MAG: helix-turn-helix domain-containing protein, partial [Acidimicrobiia bacterium]|nr:helix-turn-helix domain-containing protein [Acidimicrobiia bacterium]
MMRVMVHDGNAPGGQGGQGERALLSAVEAAARLGVKRETLYAYVSRGLLRSYAAPGGGRGRLFDADEVARLRSRPGARRATRAGHALEITSAVTSIAGGRLRYRGRDLAEFAGLVPFEAVAELLWQGELGPVAVAPWRPPAEVASAVSSLVEALPAIDECGYDVVLARPKAIDQEVVLTTLAVGS